uniref:Autophagy-related protein 27 n=1 Tax=Hanusia phi TaxID=3032 RepID=A0A7S0HAG0_9CRYP|mmetsp:Transcript_13281/g.30557  ORF Transcript_13281/g.30557 Transcript_13281/m.30557 type:complete len:274 (+) Transcript_13281:137-958(+)
MVCFGRQRTHAFLAMMVLGLGVADANRFQEAWVMNCDHTFPDGTSYDLSPLTRTAGRPDYVGKDKMGNLYYINVCSNVQEIPKECRILQKDIRSPVYQVRNDSFCHWLGMENSHSWDYIEKGSPYVGVQLTYSNGEYCQEGMNRRVKLQMYCDHLGRLGSVGDYYVTVESPCTYVVTFPTPYGCPKAASMSKGTVFIILFFTVIGAYFGGGLLINVTKYHMPLSIDSLPHIEFWRNLPELLKDGFLFIIDSIMVKLGYREPREAGGSFEWSGL